MKGEKVKGKGKRRGTEEAQRKDKKGEIDALSAHVQESDPETYPEGMALVFTRLSAESKALIDRI